MTGVNYDLMNPNGFFLPDDTVALGITAIRFPIRAAIDPAAIAGYRARDVFKFGVVDSTTHSEDSWIDGLDAYQIGNECDLVSPSSWTMTPGEYDKLVADYRGAHPDVCLIGAGLASGSLEWWRKVSPRTLALLDGYSVHPYSKGCLEARTPLRTNRAYSPKLPLWISEWNRPAPEVAVFLRMLQKEADGLVFWFGATNAMVMNMGLVDTQGNHKPDYIALRASAGG